MKVIMGRDLTSDLTKQYSVLFEKRGVKRLFSFVQDVYKAGKLREIVSFVIWEIFHKFGWFPKKDYLVFNNHEAMTFGSEQLSSPEFHAKVSKFFENTGLNAAQSAHNWKLLYNNNDGMIYGCLYPEDQDLYKSIDGGKSVIFVNRFPERIKSIFVSSRNTVFVCIKGSVYRGSDNGTAFEKTLDLGSSISFFRFNNSMTETPDKTLWMAEYGNIWDERGWRKLAYLYVSTDDGKTWRKSDFLIRRGTNKHVHIVKYSNLLNKLMVADGDNHKRLWLSDSLDTSDPESPNWNLVNKFHIQMGGYTSVVETDGKIIFGTDYQGGTNFLVETTDGRRFSKKVVPDPYRRSPIDNMIIRRSKQGDEIWANLPFSTATSKCLLMYSVDNGRSWNKVFEYKRSAYTVWLVNASKEIPGEIYFSVEDLINKDRVVYKITDRQ
jgi:hypothetical protein